MVVASNLRRQMLEFGPEGLVIQIRQSDGVEEFRCELSPKSPELGNRIFRDALRHLFPPDVRILSSFVDFFFSSPLLLLFHVFFSFFFLTFFLSYFRWSVSFSWLFRSFSLGGAGSFIGDFLESEEMEMKGRLRMRSWFFSVVSKADFDRISPNVFPSFHRSVFDQTNSSSFPIALSTIPTCENLKLLIWRQSTIF